MIKRQKLDLISQEGNNGLEVLSINGLQLPDDGDFEH
jgi:hypothetical protein